MRSIKFDEKPDYVYLRKILNGLFTKEGHELDFRYDWLIKKEGKITAGIKPAIEQKKETPIEKAVAAKKQETKEFEEKPLMNNNTNENLLKNIEEGVHDDDKKKGNQTLLTSAAVVDKKFDFRQIQMIQKHLDSNKGGSKVEATAAGVATAGHSSNNRQDIGGRDKVGALISGAPISANIKKTSDLKNNGK